MDHRVVAALMAAALLGGCYDATEENGTARLLVTQSPPDVSCLRLNVAGSRSQQRTFDTRSDASTVLLVAGLPLGTNTFVGEAFTMRCSALGPASVADWISDPVTVHLRLFPPTEVLLVMHRNAQGRVGFDFRNDPDSGTSRDADAADVTPDAASDAAPDAASDAVSAACIACRTHADCSDGRACNGLETCVNNLCSPSSPVTCSPGTTCTEPTGACRAPCAIDLDCADGRFCNGAERCVGGACVLGAPVACPVGIPCDDAARSCRCTANIQCDDGRVCDGEERCVRGSCVAGLPVACATGLLCDDSTRRCRCTADSQCDDGRFCDGAERCVAGACVSGVTPCAGVGCDESVRACRAFTGTLCAADADCDDGQFCTGTEQCMPGATGSNARGCIAAHAPRCTGGMRCDEPLNSCISTCLGADQDGDGHRSAACGGDDCDDHDRDRFPGNLERCDSSHDEDCDSMTYGVRDGDFDGYPDSGHASKLAPPDGLFRGGLAAQARRRLGRGSGAIFSRRCSNRSSWGPPGNRSAAVVPSSRRIT